MDQMSLIAMSQQHTRFDAWIMQLFESVVAAYLKLVGGSQAMDFYHILPQNDFSSLGYRSYGTKMLEFHCTTTNLKKKPLCFV